MTREAHVFVQGRHAGTLTEEEGGGYIFRYEPAYEGSPVSLALPVRESAYSFDRFPAFFDGLLPEGTMLDALLRLCELDRHDYLGQLLAIGENLVGVVTVRPAPKAGRPAS